MFWTRAAIQSNPEMVQHLLPAADERFADAQSAFVSGSATGSVYLAGYVVEMVLKHAALRTFGLGPHDYLQPALAPARARLNGWIGEVPHESYHSMEFWALSLRETFRHRKGTIPDRVLQAVQRACRLHNGWTVAMRYRSKMIPGSDAREFLSDAGWFRARANELWR